MTILDIHGRDIDVVRMANALEDWIRQPRIGKAVMARGVMDANELAVLWKTVAAYDRGLAPDGGWGWANRMIQAGMQRLLSDRRIRRVIATHLVAQGCPRRQAMAEMAIWGERVEPREMLH